jgi:FtsP/CotA-like multicopper oxidase with cupredoxin domain
VNDGARTIPRVQANDNRLPAGVMRGDTLTLRLVVQVARWFPESDSGAHVDAPVFAEEGKAPQIPGPLVRVRTGTTIAVTVRNALPDSTVWVLGLFTRPAAALDSVSVKPGETVTVRFAAGAPGTYLYGARAGFVDHDKREREQLSGAFVVDSLKGRTDDRIFVLNIWGDETDSTHYPNALAINGHSWPYTERVQASVGDTLRWRVVNATIREHPMHLHGFYYRIDAHGDWSRDTAYTPAQRRLVVTEHMQPLQTMSIAWSPDREGNWLFHCHIAFHVVPSEARLTPSADGVHDELSHDAMRHMAGLALGINVTAPPSFTAAPRGPARSLRLLVQEGRRRARAPRALGYVLQQGAAAPPADSIQISGPVLVMRRGEPTDITVVNRLKQPTSVHWHGIELESYSDGVSGWSGAGTKLAPLIAPGDSFVARLTLPRAGTFIYHTHLGDLEQLTSGLYGAIVVLEPGARFDSTTDHLFVIGWDGTEDPPHLLVNGDSLPPPLVLAAGSRHRFRLVNIGAAGFWTIRLTKDTRLAIWKRLAVDGAELPASQATMRPAETTLDVGQTADFEFTAGTIGQYLLTIGGADGKAFYSRQLVVR